MTLSSPHAGRYRKCFRFADMETVTQKTVHGSAHRPAIGFGLILGLLALVAGGKAILYDTLDPDCFWHLKVAEQLGHEGIGPVTDHLAYASSREPWTPYSWLAELGMKWVWDCGGDRAAVFVLAVVAGGGGGLVF